jgi:hypothetical protein
VALNRAVVLARSQLAIYRSRQTTCDDRTTQCAPLATGFSRPFGPKGKHSFHQALTNYLGNDSPSHSESSSWANLLSLGVLSHRALFRSVCRRGECPHLRPRSVPSCPGFEILQAGFLQVDCSSPVSRMALFFHHSTYTRRQVPARARSSRRDLGTAHRRENGMAGYLITPVLVFWT